MYQFLKIVISYTYIYITKNLDDKIPFIANFLKTLWSTLIITFSPNYPQILFTFFSSYYISFQIWDL